MPPTSNLIFKPSFRSWKELRGSYAEGGPSDITDGAYMPYTSIGSLHASVVPTQNFATHPMSMPLAPSPGLITVVTLTFLSVVLGLIAMAVTKTAWYKTGVAKRNAFKSKTPLTTIPDRNPGVVHDPKTVRLHRKKSVAHEEHSLFHFPLIIERHFAEKRAESFGRCIQFEEDHIESALDIALREERNELPFQMVCNTKVVTDAEKQEKDRERWNRPREGSDVSHVSQHSHTDGDLFSSKSTASSFTSIEEAQGEEEVEDSNPEPEGTDDEVFEVKRGQTRSLEVVKGVLLKWPTKSENAGSVSAPRLGPEDAEDEVDEEHSRLETKVPLKSQQAVAAPIPLVIVTRPSTLSLFTASSESNNSLNVLADIDQFTVPPLHLEAAAFWYRKE